MANNEICFVDFGAIGRFSTETRNTWRELQFHMQHHDIERMVRASINLAGRLPPIYIDDALTAMDEIYADWVYAITSTDAEWWERCSAQTWLRYITIAREYGIPVSLETIQFFRATLLYDSIMVRLDKDIDPLKEWKDYARQASKEARRRVNREVRKRLDGPTDMDYLRIEQFTDMANQFMFRLQKTVEDPILHFKNTVGKIAFGVSMVLGLAYTGAILIGIAVLANFIADNLFGRELPWRFIMEAIGSSIWLQLAFVLLGILFIRRLLIRMNEPDSKPDSRR
jgi:predicted unusual protein kinase regulating ubiquinone biosynthesis (AarF/ABC1/UbiB family)